MYIWWNCAILKMALKNINSEEGIKKNNLFGIERKQFVVWPQNQMRNPKYARKTVKGGGGSLILWSRVFKIVFSHFCLSTQFLWKDALHREIVEKKIYFLPTKFSPIFIRLWMRYFTVAHTLFILYLCSFQFFLRAIVCWYVTWAIVTYNMKLKEWVSNQNSFYQYSEELVQKRPFVFFLKRAKSCFSYIFSKEKFYNFFMCNY